MAQFGNQPSNSKGAQAQSKSGSGTSSASLTLSVGDTVPALDLSASSFGPCAENKDGMDDQKENRYAANIRDYTELLAETDQRLAKLKSTQIPPRESFRPGLGGWFDHKLAILDRGFAIRMLKATRATIELHLSSDQKQRDLVEESHASKNGKNNENKATGTAEQSNLQVAVIRTNEVVKRDNTDVRIARVDPVDAKQRGAQR